MNRLSTLNSRLHPWVTIKSNREELLNSLPNNVWDKLLKDSLTLSGLTRYWFQAGLQRAITEMEGTTPDGAPRFRSRQQLIERLKTITRP